VDLESGEFFWSDQAEKMLGFSEEKTKKTIDDYIECVYPEDRQEVMKAIDNCLHGEKGYDIEHRVIWPDNSIRWLQACGGVIYNDADQVQRMVGVLRDITDKKEADAILEDTMNKLRTMNERMHDAQEQLLRSEKMASIGQLAAGVAHEINNPIGYISSNVGTLKKYVDDLFDLIEAYESTIRPDSEKSIVSYINKVKQEIDIDYLQQDLRDLIAESEEGIVRVKRIVQDLKDFSHVEEVEWEEADLHQGIDSTLNIVRNEIKYKAEIVKEYGEIPDVECIISQLNQVFMNLLVNASQAISEGSNGVICIRTYVEDGGVAIEIEDSGSGMPKEMLNKIFDPFFTTKPIGKGTGLGLSLSYAIINKHGGKISVTSEEGKGSLFKLWLPEKQEQKVEHGELIVNSF
jgi:PAS domain S-box-containing protein